VFAIKKAAFACAFVFAGVCLPLKNRRFCFYSSSSDCAAFGGLF